MLLPRTLRRALVALGASLAPLAFAQSAPLTPPATAPSRIEQLRAELAHHDELYFKHAAPEITDAEYDRLKQEFRALLATAPAAEDSAATDDNSLGDDRTGRFVTARHLVPVLGLAKAYREAELRAFFARVQRAAGDEPLTWVIEPKYDGLSISVTYERGRLVRAITRGDGREGDLVTANLLACSDVPRELRGAPAAAVPDLIELRGEAYVDWAEFRRLNEERRIAGEPPFAHPRNLAVGTLKSTDPTVLQSRRLRVVFYGWGACEPASVAPLGQMDLLARLGAWGLAAPPAQRAPGADQAWASVRAFGRTRADFGGPTDGVVVKVDSAVQRARLGETAEVPLWAIAYKFAPERVATRLRAITYQIGRTGVVTPVAELEPVELGGTTISRASLHNLRELTRRDYRLGDTVFVEKAGEIVPQLAGVDLARRAADSRPLELPIECPWCDATLVPDGAAALRCPDRSCVARLKRRVEFFVSEAALDVRGFGPALVASLVDRKVVRELDDVLRLAAPVVPARVAEQLARARQAELSRVIVGLGLPEVGPANARRLAEHFQSLAALARADEADLSRAGLGAASAAAVAEELRVAETQRLLARLSAAGVGEPAAPVAEPSGELRGKNVVFTGALRGLTRAQAAERVRRAGGQVQSAVSASTHFVVAGEGAGQKLEAAAKRGVRVLSEAEFLALVGGAGGG